MEVNHSFETRLRKFLANCKKIAIIGVGNPLLGDDSIGNKVIDLLAERNVNVDLFKAFQAPENVLSKFLESDHSHIIVIDAAEMGLNPGDFKIIEIEMLPNETITTHTVPLKLMLKSLISVGKKVLVIGIQIEKVGFYEVSEKVVSGINKLIEILYEVLKDMCSYDSSKIL